MLGTKIPYILRKIQGILINMRKKTSMNIKLNSQLINKLETCLLILLIDFELPFLMIQNKNNRLRQIFTKALLKANLMKIQADHCVTVHFHKQETNFTELLRARTIHMR
jgi:hypothetical protein